MKVELEKRIELGERIKEVRTELGLTLRELADKSGVSHCMLCRLENAQSAMPKANRIKSIANALNLPAEHLFQIIGAQRPMTFPQETVEEKVATVEKSNWWNKVVDWFLS